MGKRGPKPIPPHERFWDKVRKTDTCWVWLAGEDGHGYGAFGFKRPRVVKAHRFAYEQMVGPIPDDLELDHLCRNRLCVNPMHLEPVTHVENCRRGRNGWHNTIKTHCPQGHAYADWTRLYQGRRYCRACERERRRLRTEAARRIREAVQ